VSWDIWLSADVGGEEPVEIGATARNYTSNVGPMLCRAMGGSLSGLEGVLAEEATPLLEQAIIAMEVEEAEMRALNPENGWGDYDSFIGWLYELLADTRRYPKAIVGVWC
jgi:hypothetical protein